MATTDQDPKNRNENSMKKEGAQPLPQEAQGRIGRELRNSYSVLLNEPLPDKFTKLIDELAKTEKAK